MVRNSSRSRRRQRGEARVVSAPQKQPEKKFVEQLSGAERIGDREVEFTRHFDEKGHQWTYYGSGPSYLCYCPRRKRYGRWFANYDYRAAIIELQLSRRTTRKGDPFQPWPASPEEAQTYLFENAVECLHKKLANDPMHRVAGDISGTRRFVRDAVIRSLRDLDPKPIRKLAAAVDAVRWVEERPRDNDLVILAIVRAARLHDSVPFRSEVLDVLKKLDSMKISCAPNAFNQRLKAIGFGWLPGGRIRKMQATIGSA